MGVLEPRQRANYYSIKAGNIVKEAKEGDAGAIERSYIINNQKKTTWEYQFPGIRGRLIKIEFYEFDYDGKNVPMLRLFLKDKDNVDCVSVGYGTRYASSIMEAICGINITQDITLEPYNYTNKKGKPVSGVKISQPGGQVFFFKEWDDVAKKFIYKNGLPEPTADIIDADDWKYYFAKTNKFMKNYIIDIFSKKLESEYTDNSVDELSHIEQEEEEYPIDKDDFIPKPKKKIEANLNDYDDDLPF